METSHILDFITKISTQERSLAFCKCFELVTAGEADIILTCSPNWHVVNVCTWLKSPKSPSFLLK